MSVVAAKISDNKITMSADSIILSGWQRKDQEHFKAAKMCKTNGMLIGSCGSLQESSMFQVFVPTINRNPLNSNLYLNL